LFVNKILISSVIKIANLSPYWLQIKFSMSLFFYLFILRSICGTENSSQQTSLQCLSTINIVFSNEDKILIKKSLHLKGYTAKRLTDEFLEKSSTKRGVNKLLKKLRDTDTVDRRLGSGRPRNEKNSHAFICLIFQIFCYHINTLSIHSYTHRRTTSSSAIVEGPRDALSQLKSCQVLHNCTKNHIWLEGFSFHVV